MIGERKVISFVGMAQSSKWTPPDETVNQIKARKYECFMEDHEPKPWTPGRCAGYAGKGSLALHLFRCKRKDGQGLGGLFCAQHAKTGGY